MSVRHVAYRPKVSILGLVAGLFGGFGGLVFLQQHGNVFPTQMVGLISLLGGLLLGGVIAPSVGRLVAVSRINRRLRRSP